MISLQDLFPLAAGLGILWLAVSTARVHADQAGYGWFGVAFALLLLGWATSFAETWLDGTGVNLLEHGAPAAAAVAFSVGCWRLLRSTGTGAP